MKNLLFILLVLLSFNIYSQEYDINITYDINVTVESRANYKLNGVDVNGDIAGLDPEITIDLGSTINFNVDAPGHPFLIKNSAGIGRKDMVKNAKNNGATKGLISWMPLSPGTYYYQCSKHKKMVGVITVNYTR